MTLTTYFHFIDKRTEVQRFRNVVKIPYLVNVIEPDDTASVTEKITELVSVV
jgi:tetrahydromethanopterin S-methyltransferase subunit A